MKQSEIKNLSAAELQAKLVQLKKTYNEKFKKRKSSCSNKRQNG